MDVGDKLGSYELLEKLGEGGMAVVYKANDLSLQHEVVIKFPKDNFAQNPKYLQIFEEEGRKLAKLRSPYILSVIAADYLHEPPYIVLEYLEGKSLEEILEVMSIHDRGVLPEEKAIEIIRKVAEGLATAHREGIIHCDINPSNIMLSYNDKVTVMDFGIAQAASDQPVRPSSVVGNPGYMSPEQIEGKPLDPRTDIYSLGAVFFEMVTGRAPFESDSIEEMLDKALNSSPANPRSFNKNISPKVASMILTMLEKDPDKRYHSMPEIVNELLEAKKSKTSDREVQKAKASRNNIFVFVLILLALCAMLFSYMVYDLTQQNEKGNAAQKNNVTQDIRETIEPAAGFIEKAPSALPVPGTVPPKSVSVPAVRPVKKAAVPRADGTLVISSVPDGATLYLNNVYKGNTPIFKKLAPGRYALKLELEGYSSYRELMVINSGSSKKLNIELTPLSE
ncbi:MAG: serine/threonine-protein kinase [Candidatus Margulisiibacteriota bacterium]|jgi:serine/threonine protein kinase